MLLVAVLACACSSSSSTPPEADASTDATSPITDSAAPSDSTAPDAPSVSDGGGTDSSDARADAYAGDAGCGWTGSYESPACSSCLASFCCAVTTVCLGDPACAALDTCVNACDAEDDAGEAGSVSSCAQACADQETDEVRYEYQSWTQCIGTSCGANSGAGPCL